MLESPAPPTPLRRALAEAGFQVQIANSGHLALAAVRKSSPDIVVLRADIGPPGPSEIARRIKCGAETADIPVLLLDSEAHPPPFAYPTEARLAHDAGESEIIRTVRMLTTRPRRVCYGGSPPRERASLAGDLATDDFVDVLQFLFTSRKTGRVEVIDRLGRRGLILVDDAKVVGATLGARFGVSAFRELCFLSAGTFRFHPGRVSLDGSMDESGLELLLEAARRKDVDDRDRARVEAGAGDGDAALRRTAGSPPVLAWAAASTGPADGRRAPMSRKSIGAALLVLVGLGAGSFLARSTLERAPDTVTLDIRSEPDGARVFVDERDIGTTPLDAAPVEPGRRLVRLEKEGSETTVALVDVSKGEVGRSLRFTLPDAPLPRAVLKLRRLPSRAKIFVDGVQQPGTSTELAPGLYRVDIEAAGFHRWSERIQLEPAMQKVLDVELRPAE